MRLNLLAFALGVLFLQTQPALPAGSGAFFLAGALVILSVVAAFQRGFPLLRWLAVAVWLAVGFGYAAWRAEIRLDDALAESLEGHDIEIVGHIASLPQDFSQGSRFEFAVEQTLTANAAVPGRILLSYYQGRRDDEVFTRLPVMPGERWRFTVRLKRPHGNANPGGFDYEAWLLERGIRATGYIRPDPPQRLDTFVWGVESAVERLRYHLRERFNRLMPADHFPFGGVLVALAIGDQKAVQSELWTTFNRTGTTHLMSISGLHVTMVAALFGFLVAAVWRRMPVLALRFPTQHAGLLAACLGALLYALLAGFAVPAQRTLYMLLVAALAMLSGRNFAPSRTLVLALWVVLLVDPWSVLAAGFWLSFGAVAALLYAGSPLVGEAPGWRGKLADWGSVQWVATLTSLPVLLLIFQQLSLVSPLANALAIPVVSFIITPLALLVAIFPWPPLAWLAHQVMVWLMAFLEWCATWPVWQVPAPPLWAALLAGIGVVVALLPRGLPGRGLGLLMIVPILIWPIERPEEGEAWIDVLDVGQGLASVVRTRQHVLIYDPGPLYSAESDAGQRVVVPYLRWLGIDRVDRLIVTHRDSDHSGGTASVRAALPVGDLLSSVPDLPGQLCVAGQQWRWDGVDFRILHPLPGAFAVNGKSNHVSCVLHVAAGGKSMLLTSDIEAPDETALLARAPQAVKADILLVPHHGSRTSSTPAFLAAVAPTEAIIPVGYRNRFGHPKADVLARYIADGIRVWRTDQGGAVQVRLSEDQMKITAWRENRPRYWYAR